MDHKTRKRLAKANGLTPSQLDALEWLSKHANEGMFDRNGVLLAAGETAPFMRSTWNNLETAGHVHTWSLPSARGSRTKRLGLTDRGQAVAAQTKRGAA